ncbi:MAG: sulfite exporter TauE/SafE family protein, partial [Brachymonas denitrificans]
MWTSLLLGLSIGAVMGLTGAGGGILAIPALVLGIGLDMVSAKPVALLAATAGAMLGA